MTERELQDLEIAECIPNCEQCPGIWVNKLINHQIVCVCCKNCHKGVKK